MNEQECPKCHNIGMRLEATVAKWCDCPLAKRYIASLRQIGQSPAVLKWKIGVIQRRAIDRLAELAMNCHKITTNEADEPAEKTG